MTDQPETYEIRPASVSDFVQVSELYGHLSPNDIPVSASVQKSTFAQILDHPGMSILVAALQGRLVATLTLVVVPNLTRGCAPYALIENVVTHLEFRGQGFGQKLIADAIQRAWDNGCYKVMLLSGSQNDKAR